MLAQHSPHQGTENRQDPGRAHNHPQINQRGIPYHMTSVQIQKLRKGGRKWGTHYFQHLPSGAIAMCAEALPPRQWPYIAHWWEVENKIFFFFLSLPVCAQPFAHTLAYCLIST